MLSHGEHSILKVENKIRNVFASPFIIIAYFYIKQIVNIFLLSSLTFNILGSYFLPNFICWLFFKKVFIFFLLALPFLWSLFNNRHDFYFWKNYYLALYEAFFIHNFVNFQHYWANSLRKVFYYQFFQMYIVIRK